MDDLEKIFEDYGPPVSIYTLHIHENISLYEYQSPELYSVLKEPNDTIDVYEITFRNRNNKYIFWITMENDSLVIIDRLEYNYHTIQF